MTFGEDLYCIIIFPVRFLGAFGRVFPSASPLTFIEALPQVLLQALPNLKNGFQPKVMEKPFCNLYYGGEAKNSGFPRLLPHM
jgi:hypothetical protein